MPFLSNFLIIAKATQKKGETDSQTQLRSIINQWFNSDCSIPKHETDRDAYELKQKKNNTVLK